jgi:5-methylcytosine-specific restriction endonuclease McrA
MRTRQQKLDYLKEYRTKYSERISLQKKQWYQKNKERQKEKMRQNYEDNKQAYIDRANLWKSKNPEKAKQSKQNWCINNQEYFKEWKKQNPNWDRDWRINNADKIRMYSRQNRIKRRLLLKNVKSESYTLEEIYIRDEGMCMLCFTNVAINAKEMANRPSIDHIIPLSKGGDDTLNNVQLAHFGCNSRKGNRI